MKDGKVVLMAQAEMDDELDEMCKKAHWANITMGMETLGKIEYENELHGPTQLLDPSNPLALTIHQNVHNTPDRWHQLHGPDTCIPWRHCLYAGQQRD